MVTEGRSLYYPTVPLAKKIDLALNSKKITNKQLIGLLVDILVIGKRNEFEVRSAKDWKRALAKRIAPTLWKFPRELIVNSFASWNYVPDSLFGALTNALKRQRASELEKASAEIKNKKPVIDAELLGRISDMMGGAVHAKHANATQGGKETRVQGDAPETAFEY